MKKLNFITVLALILVSSVAEAALGDHYSNGLAKFGTVAPSLVATRAPASILSETSAKGCGYEGGLVNCAINKHNTYTLLMPHQ